MKTTNIASELTEIKTNVRYSFLHRFLKYGNDLFIFHSRRKCNPNHWN